LPLVSTIVNKNVAKPGDIIDIIDRFSKMARWLDEYEERFGEPFSWSEMRGKRFLKGPSINGWIETGFDPFARRMWTTETPESRELNFVPEKFRAFSIEKIPGHGHVFKWVTTALSFERVSFFMDPFFKSIHVTIEDKIYPDGKIPRFEVDKGKDKELDAAKLRLKGLAASLNDRWMNFRPFKRSEINAKIEGAKESIQLLENEIDHAKRMSENRDNLIDLVNKCIRFEIPSDIIGKFDDFITKIVDDIKKELERRSSFVASKKPRDEDVMPAISELDQQFAAWNGAGKEGKI